MSKIYFIVFACCLLLQASLSNGQAKPGETLPLWSEGYLDIHFINTGKGESAFYILPDGTTMLVDAGEALSKKPWATDPKPNGSRTPGEWIARYIQHMLQRFPDKKLNYAMISHFHWDHMGGVDAATKMSANGAYKLSGITEVGDVLPIGTLIDRGWPDYNWPVPLDDEKMQNYKRFIDWQSKHRDMKVEKIKVGRDDQLVLKHHPEKYPNFEIRNIAANGEVWTGVGDNTRMQFPPLKDLAKKDYPPENKCSIAFRLSYGKFDFFTGGDLDVRDAEEGGMATIWKDMETPVTQVTGPVEVCKADHHGNYEANSVNFFQALRPRVIVICTWGASQPAMNVYRRMISGRTYAGPRDIFATNIMRETSVAFNVDKLKSKQGHVVIRVNPGGDTYYVYVLDDSNENFIIKSVFGPYQSR